MKNRIIAFVTLGSFLIFCWSCTSIQEIKPEVLAKAKPGDYEIRKVEKTTGETIEYSDESPGQVGQGQITGTGMLTIALKTMEVDRGGLEITSKPGVPLMQVKTRDGRTYEGVNKIEEREDKSVLHILKTDRRELISSPVFFSDIQKAWTPKFDIGKTIAFLITAAAVVPSIILAIAFRGWSSSSRY